MKRSFILSLVWTVGLFLTVSQITAQVMSGDTNPSEPTATVLATWTFENVTTSNTGSTPVVSAGSAAADSGAQAAGSSFTGFHASSAAAWSNPAGNGSAKSLSSNGWAVGDYYQFQFNTSGYSGISITWDQTGSNTGPRDFKVQYSTDGTTFTDATGTNSTYSVTNDAWTATTNNPVSTRTLDLSGVTALNNQPTVYIRLVNTTTTAITGGTVASTGSNRVDNFTVSAANGPGGGGTAPVQHVADYNGDGKTDYTIFRGGASGTAAGTFWTRFSGGTAATDVSRPFGITSDTVITADFDGDKKTDLAIWRQGAGRTSAYWVLNSSDNTTHVLPFGQAFDDPTLAADYTGDGHADPAIYRTSTGEFWYLASSGPFAGQQVVIPFGQSGDVAVPGDYNGDGKADFTIYRPNGTPDKVVSVWTMFNSGNGNPGAVIVRPFGTTDDFFTPGDYDGDGKTDLCVTRLSGNTILWIYRPSSGGADVFKPWGVANDYVVPGDYDGDGKTDFATYRDVPGQFWVLNSSDQSTLVTPWGVANDFPVNASGY